MQYQSELGDEIMTISERLKKKHKFHKDIIKKYDIRGTYNVDLTDGDAYFLGRSFSVFLRENNLPRKVCVGRDGRDSSPNLERELIRGLVDSGAEVVRLGLIATPMLYFATHTIEGFKSGIMVTGSHNPADQNGFKMVANLSPVFDEEIVELAEIALEGRFIKQLGEVNDACITDKYLETVTTLNSISNSAGALKVVWDPANGAACNVITSLTRKIGGDHIIINGKTDGKFPSHHADPTIPENLTQLINEVKIQKADLGISFDGDGDRIGVVDAEGRILFGDHLMLIFIKDIISRTPGAKMIADIKTSQIALESVREWGGEAILWKTGHSFVKRKMKQERAIFAAEVSGHIFFADNYYGYDDAIFAACRLLQILANTGKSLSQFYDEMPKATSTPEIRIDCAEKHKFKIVEQVVDHIRKTNTEFIDIDGVRVHKEHGWWLLRGSNTQSCLVARIESYDPMNLSILCQDLIDTLKKLEIPVDLSALEKYAAA